MAIWPLFDSNCIHTTIFFSGKILLETKRKQIIYFSRIFKYLEERKVEMVFPGHVTVEWTFWVKSDDS